MAYVNQGVGAPTDTLTTVAARYEDAPVIDLINPVREDVVREALAGTEYASLPVLSQASPFSRTSEIPAGSVMIRDLSGVAETACWAGGLFWAVSSSGGRLLFSRPPVV